MKKEILSLATPSLTPNAITVLEKRYFNKDKEGKIIETAPEMFYRVAEHIAKGELKFGGQKDVVEMTKRFYVMMAKREFLPNSPTLMNAGKELGQLSACFVLPVGDSMEEIFDAVKYTALIHKSGGGTGFSFSRLRPANDMVMSTKGVSSGPLSFMRVFDVATETIKQGGTRRGANMAILRVDHPDIMDFISCKKDLKMLNNFNISVGLTEAFMEAAKAGRKYDIINPRDKKVVGQLDAVEVFNTIVKDAWETGEPGIIFIDRLNRDNPTPHIGEIESTNPCGEQPLLPYESCNLGSINLGLMVKNGKIDWTHLKSVVHDAVRFLDNVIEMNKYPIPQIDEMTRANRKIGLGVMGWADMLILLDITYDSKEATDLGEKVMKFITDEGRKASIELAKVRGAFPNFKGSIYDVPGAQPVRNATVSTIAPTGTISMIGNASSGVEPLFAVSFVRQVMDKDILVEVNPLFERIAKEEGFYSKELMEQIALSGSVKDFTEIPEKYRRVFVGAQEISPAGHVNMQAAFQKYTDNAVSKTVNFKSDATIEDVETVYRLAYETGCKGVTIYRDGSRDEQVLSTGATSAAKATEAPVAQVASKPVKRERPKALKGYTYQMQTGCGPLYITVNEDDQGAFEVFTTMGKAGGCAASQCEAMGRLVSTQMRYGLPVESVIKQMVGISCHSQAGFGENKVLSCADAMGKAILLWQQQNGVAVASKQVAMQKGACPECGGLIVHEGGCAHCVSCAFSECA